MNAPERMVFPDLQSQFDSRNIRIDGVVKTELAGAMAIEELIAIAEGSASCEVYSPVKRADEKCVTELAYDNPKFVEDLVRDVALALNREPRIRAYVVEAENFGSIHSHTAFARIVSPSKHDTVGACPNPRSRSSGDCKREAQHERV